MPAWFSMGDIAAFGPFLGVAVYFWRVRRNKGEYNEGALALYAIEGFLLLGGLHLILCTTSAPGMLFELFKGNVRVDVKDFECRIEPLHKAEIIIGAFCAVLVSAKGLFHDKYHVVPKEQRAQMPKTRR